MENRPAPDQRISASHSCLDRTAPDRFNAVPGLPANSFRGPGEKAPVAARSLRPERDKLNTPRAMKTWIHSWNRRAHGAATGNRFRTTIQLVDRAAARQFWSERFDSDLDHVLGALDKLAARASTAVRYQVYQHETERSEQRPIEEQSSQELMGETGHIPFQSRWTSYERSRELISVVIEREPDNAVALAIGAWGRAMLEVIRGCAPIAPEDGALGLGYT
jgi:hypothetical protein